MKKIPLKAFASPLRFQLFVFVLIIFSFCFNSCRKQADNTGLTERISADEPIRTFTQRDVSSITYQRFLDSVNKFGTANLTSLFRIAPNDGQIKANTHGASNDITLCIDSIKLMQKGGHITYTIPLKQSLPNDVKFRNVIIDVFEQKVSTFLITYTPDTTFLNNHVKGIKGRFTGKVHVEPFNLTSTSQETQINSTSTKSDVVQLTICTVIQVYAGSDMVRCSCEGHTPENAACTCENKGYYEPRYESATVCADVTISLPWYTNGGGGDGPVTPPTTPPDYDPCAPVGGVSSTIKVNGLPGPCNPAPPTVPPPPPPAYTVEVQALIDLLHLTGTNLDYIVQNPDVANELVYQLEADGLTYENITAVHMTILAEAANVTSISNPAYFYNVVSPALANYPPTDPILFAQYFAIECAIIKAENPTWNYLRVMYEASKEMLHLGLDGLGLAPGFGEIADLVNGVLYTIEGDGVNATLSYASAIPIAGWFASGAKFAKRGLTLAGGSKTTLKWAVKAGNIINFGDRAQLRRVLLLAKSDLRQAHHILPWAKQNHWAIQKAAKSKHAFHMNEAANGIALNNVVHLGSHANYDLNVVTRLEAISKNLTPEQTYDAVQNIINNIRTAMINHPNTHVNDLVF